MEQHPTLSHPTLLSLMIDSLFSYLLINGREEKKEDWLASL